MNWTRPVDLKAQVERLWERGLLLADIATGKAFEPLPLVLKRPTAGEVGAQFSAVRSWIGELTSAAYFRIELREVNNRLVGTNRIPAEAWVDSRESALALIGKTRDARRFEALVAVTRAREPLLLPWLAQKPLRALEYAADWDLLLAIVRWLQGNPRPNIYPRQVDVSGVHTKFIESRKGILNELLTVALPAQAIDANVQVSQFERRFGFKEKPTHIRIRSLDSAIRVLPGVEFPDLTLDIESFAKLQLPVKRIFIVENQINFLAFPKVAESLCIWGAGYGWESIAQARWLDSCAIYYWGDIDTHGLAILNQLRGNFRHVESFLMDHSTLMAHEDAWGVEEKQALAPATTLGRLRVPELALYEDLQQNCIRANLRFEQEKVVFSLVEKTVADLLIASKRTLDYEQDGDRAAPLA